MSGNVLFDRDVQCLIKIAVLFKEIEEFEFFIVLMIG